MLSQRFWEEMMSEEKKNENLEKAKEGFDKAKTATADATKEIASNVGRTYNEKVKPIVALTASPHERARRSGKYLARLGISWGILSVIGAIIIAFQSDCEDYSSAYDYCRVDETYPYVGWAIGSIFANIVIASLLYAIGSYIEARMTEEPSH
ncbi:MAG: hypothetical protein LW686_03080 [Ilumatobacteraceae bacterium]|nr:hypothetical protein [Ilumatobacteraceae bacterium]